MPGKALSRFLYSGGLRNKNLGTMPDELLEQEMKVHAALHCAALNYAYPENLEPVDPENPDRP